jgi:hypothetical protein
MGEQRTPHAAATQQAASDEEPQHPAFSAFAFVVLVLILVFVVILAALA